MPTEPAAERVIETTRETERVFTTLIEKVAAVSNILSGGFTTVLNRLSGSLGELQGIFGNVAGRVGKWVEALNPSQMFAFSVAMRDLQATLGYAFTGVIDVFMKLARDVASALMPAMEALRPALTAIARAFADILVPIVKILAAILQVVAPILQVVGQIFQAFAPVIEAVAVALAALAQTVADFLSSLNAGGILSLIGTFFKAVASGILILVALVAKLFGAQGFIDKMIKNLQPDDKEQKAAIRGVGIQDFAAIARQMDVLSAAAQGGGAEKTEEEKWRDGVIEKLQEIRNSNGFLQAIYQICRDIYYALPGTGRDPLRGTDILPETYKKRQEEIDAFRASHPSWWWGSGIGTQFFRRPAR